MRNSASEWLWRGGWAWCVLAAPMALAGPAVQYDRDILPILSEKCYTCHGPDAQTRKAGLRLDVPDAPFQRLPSGATAVVPKDRDASALWQRIVTADPDDRMPPPDQPKQLSEAETALIGRWIDEGAAWGRHWSFVPAAMPPVPAVQRGDWPRNDIDRFVLARLEAEGLAPAPEADRRTLLRRVTLDLTGLPPTPQEAADFAADAAPDAYERLLDRLFASPRYGEHMARYWLDLARYADTNGYHIDNERYMWPWRDWVIRKFNENLPFDDFTRQQIAGDLIPGAALEQKIGSGFNRNHMINFEGGIIAEEYRSAYVVDRTNTTGTVWLGLSVGCAQCHAHKYDPITQQDYYRLYGFFNTIEEQGIDGRDGNSNPLVRVPAPEDEAEQARLDERIAALRVQLDAPMPEIDAAEGPWLAGAEAASRARWIPLDAPQAAAEGGVIFAPQPDGSLLAGGENPADAVYTVTAALPPGKIAALRLDAFPDPSLPGGSNGRAENGNFVLSEFEAEVAPAGAPEQVQRIAFQSASADFAQQDFPIANAIDGKPETGWASEGDRRKSRRTALFVADAPFGFDVGTALTVRLRHASGFKQHAIGRFRIAYATGNTIARTALGTWQHNGPFVAADGKKAYGTAFEPEQTVDLAATYPDGRMKWIPRPDFADAQVFNLPGGLGANYLFRTLTVPGPRTIQLGLGSNDGLKVWLNGRVVHDNDVQRGAAADQDAVALKLDAGENRLLVKVINYGNAHQFFFRIKEDDPLPVPLKVELALETPAEARGDADRERLRKFYRQHFAPAWKALDDERAALEEQKRAIEKRMPNVMIMAEQSAPRETFVLKRGQYDQPLDKVAPGTPEALHALPAGAAPNRLGLAEWLVARDNPLTPRVTANRFWMHFFGAGLVRTAEDFGTQGERPSHPELLDWLAVSLMDSGWDVKAFQRMIVSSAAYRQSSAATPALIERDPANRLIARGPRFRMDAEAVRDNALAVAGLLVEKIGGPSVNPYGPKSLWKEVSYGAEFTAQDFVQGTGEDLYRRSLYTFWKRQAPPANMMLFDAPNRETCTVRRSRTNTPLQALALMNDPQFVEAARALAQRAMREAGEAPEARIAHAFELATARIPTGAEQAVLLELYRAQADRYRADPQSAAALIGVGESAPDPALDPADLAAWSAVAGIILNLDETITKG